MKKLEEYEVLKTTFYRGEYLLKYIARHPDMSELDKEAIKATIMNALVYKGCIQPEKEFLDWDALAITNDKKGYPYEEYPFITGYPLWLKEEARKRIIKWSGSIPISVHAARPSGRVTYCIYDANIVMSVFFDDFSFIEASYDSPTRPGIRVEGRPFLEVTMGEKIYLVDTITKRFFEEKEFLQRYHLEVTYRINKKNFTLEQQEIYREQTEDRKREYSNFLAFSKPMLGTFSTIPNFEEYCYELEVSKSIFPASWEEADRLIAESEAFMSREIPWQFVKNNNSKPHES